MSRLYNIINAIITPFGKSLWTGTWSSGEITVSGSSKYCVFLIGIKDDYSAIGYRSANNSIRIIGGTSSGDEMYTMGGSIGTNGEKWTLYSCQSFHHRSAGHTKLSNKTINSVVGLVPNWGGVVRLLKSKIADILEKGGVCYE